MDLKLIHQVEVHISKKSKGFLKAVGLNEFLLRTVIKFEFQTFK
jgi:hypothetical protein